MGVSLFNSKPKARTYQSTARGLSQSLSNSKPHALTYKFTGRVQQSNIYSSGLSVLLSIYLSVYLFICLSIHLFIYYLFTLLITEIPNWSALQEQCIRTNHSWLAKSDTHKMCCLTISFCFGTKSSWQTGQSPCSWQPYPFTLFLLLFR